MDIATLYWLCRTMDDVIDDEGPMKGEERLAAVIERLGIFLFVFELMESLTRR